MAPDYFIVHSAYEKLKTYPKKKEYERNEYEKYEKIFDAFITTELFCITCCVKHTEIICSNSNIPIKNYSVGYTHNTQEKIYTQMEKE